MTYTLGNEQAATQHTAPVLISSHVGLRGVAALLVVFYHNYFLPNHLPFEDWSKFFARGYLMVDLFFILSGFIMLHVYKEIQLNQNSYYDFFTKRLARIYPLHIVSLLGLLCAKILLFILYWIDGKSVEAFWRTPGTWEAFVAQLMLIHSFLPTEPGWNIPSWSISAEMFAYLLFPLVAVLLRRYVRTTSALMLLFSVSYYGVVASTTGSLDVTHGSAPARCLAGFLAGMLINHHARQMLPSNQPLILSFVQCLTIVFICIILSVEVNDIFVIPFFIVLVATTLNDTGIISNIMSRKMLHFLGDISYSVYLTHVPIFFIMHPIFLAITKRVGLGPLEERAIWLPLSTIVVVLVSAATFRFIEMPARSWLSTQIKRRKPALT